jgi:hypothetical protein
MKKITLLLLMMFSLHAFSQEIYLEKGKYYVNGKQIPTRELRQLLTSNVEASSLFRKAKSKESNGGLLMGIGIGLTVSDLARALSSDVSYPSGLTFVGLGFIAVSIPVLSGKSKKIKKSIEVYNRDYKNLGFDDDTIELNVISNQNGYGLQFRF